MENKKNFIFLTVENEGQLLKNVVFGLKNGYIPVFLQD